MIPEALPLFNLPTKACMLEPEIKYYSNDYDSKIVYRYKMNRLMTKKEKEEGESTLNSELLMNNANKGGKMLC